MDARTALARLSEKRLQKKLFLFLYILLLGVLLTMTGLPGVAQAIRLKNVSKISIDSLRFLLKKPNLTDSSRYLALNNLATKLEAAQSPKALEASRQCLAFARKLKQPEWVVKSLLNIGHILRESPDFILALKYLHEGLMLAEYNHLGSLIPDFYNNISVVAHYTADYPRAIQYMRMAYHAQSKLPRNKLTPPQRIGVLFNLANSFLHNNQDDSAQVYIQKALVIAQQANDLKGLCGLSALKGVVFNRISPRTPALLDSSVLYLNKAIKYGQLAKNNRFVASSAVNLADLYRMQGKPTEMQQAAELALALATNDPRLRVTAYRSLSYAYADQGKHDLSGEYDERARKLQDTVMNGEKARAIGEFQVKFNVQQLEQRNRLAEEQNRVVAARAMAARARVALLTQENRVATAQQQVQRTNIELLAEQNRAAEAQAQAQTTRVQLLTQEKRAAQQLEQGQRARNRWLLLSLGGAVLVVLTVGLLYWNLRKRRAALALANGALASANADISRSAAEKEVLLQEIHHRVKNNLQLVSSLLGWQSSINPDPVLVQALAGSQARVQSMALVHELLYLADNLAEVNLDTYVTKLLDTLYDSYHSPQQPITITTDLAPLVMTAKEAIPFGLLVNELVTNAYKHAFRGRSSGNVHVTLCEEAGSFQLTVADDGVGMPATGTGRVDSLGVHLVSTLARQLKAQINFEPNQPAGTRVVLSRSCVLKSRAQDTPALATEAA